MEGYRCEGANVCNRSADLLAPGCYIMASLPAADFSGLTHSMRLANAVCCPQKGHAVAAHMFMHINSYSLY
jgi:hypothetical protein